MGNNKLLIWMFVQDHVIMSTIEFGGLSFQTFNEDQCQKYVSQINQIQYEFHLFEFRDDDISK